MICRDCIEILSICAIPSGCHQDCVFFILVDACRLCVHVCLCCECVCVLCVRVYVLCGFWCLLSSVGLCVCVNPFCGTVFRSFAHEWELISGVFFDTSVFLPGCVHGATGSIIFLFPYIFFAVIFVVVVCVFMSLSFGVFFFFRDFLS